MMAETGAWMPMYWGDYFGDTMHLTTEEHGAYLLLIGAYWRRGGPLPDDDKLLKNITKLSPFQWKNYRETLAEFFEISQGTWKHKRVQKEIDSACLRVARARKGGIAKAANKQVPSTATAITTKEVTASNEAVVVSNGNDPTPDLPSIPEILRRKPDGEVQKMFANYNWAAAKFGLPEAKKLTRDRQRKLEARRKEHGLEGWTQALLNIKDKPFLRGENERSWKADLDFLLQPKSLNRLIEGGYGGEKEWWQKS